MAVDLMNNFPKLDEQKAIQEAASQGLKTMEHLIYLLSNQQQPKTHLNRSDYAELTDVTVSKFKKVITLLNRTGHARFRRGPVQSSPSCPSYSPPYSSSSVASLPLSEPPTLTLAPPPVYVAPVPVNLSASFVPAQPQSMTLDFSKPSILTSNQKSMELESAKESFSVSSSSSLMSSAITGDGSVSNGKTGSIFLTPAPTVSGGKPPLSSAPFKKRCHEHSNSEDVSGKISMSGSGSVKCHCSKRK